MNKIIRKTFRASETKSIDSANRKLTVAISTISPDRSGDIVRPDGCVLDNYKNNPVVAAFHQYNQPSIGSAKEITLENDRIVATPEFARKGVNPMADMLFELYKDGHMNAWSIGFMPLEWNELKGGGREFTKWELLEFSAVLVPDNPEAVTLARSLAAENGISDDVISKALAEPEEEEVEKPKVEESLPDNGVVTHPVTAPSPEEVGVEGDKKTVKPEEKGVAEVVNLAYLIADLNWLMNYFSQNEKNENLATKMGKALAILMECIKDEASLTEKTFVKKEGRVLSDKNKKLVEGSIAKLEETAASLKDLLEATESKSIEKKEEVTPEGKKLLFDVRNELRKTDKGVGVLLRKINLSLKDNSGKGVK